MIKVQISKSTGKIVDIAENGKKTLITGLPPQADLKAIKARRKAMGLPTRSK